MSVDLGPLHLLIDERVEGTDLRLTSSLRLAASLRAVAFVVFLSGSMSASLTITAPAHASGAVLEERKMPMRFTWIDCQPNCRGWIGAVGIVTSDTPKDFKDFAADRDLAGATVVLDSSGGSVNDAIVLGRRWRKLGLRTTVGATVEINTPSGMQPMVVPQAYCESMCVFLLLSGKTRYVPEEARVRVHQIWMGDRAEDPKSASYTAQDLMIVERDIGRLAKYTFDMGGTGDLLSLSLSVPPWDDLHTLTLPELRLTNLVTTDAVADVLPANPSTEADVASLTTPKAVQDRFVSSVVDESTTLPNAPAANASSKSTKTAEASMPTGGAAVTPAPPK